MLPILPVTSVPEVVRIIATKTGRRTMKARRAKDLNYSLRSTVINTVSLAVCAAVKASSLPATYCPVYCCCSWK